MYYHGDSNRDNNFYMYKNKNIIDSRWDFKHNVCCNSVILNKKTNPAILKCLGHTLNIQNVSTILSYEIHKDWMKGNNLLENSMRCVKGVGICQWFMITEPKQEIFLKSFEKCIKNIDFLINLNNNNKNYIDIVFY
jgi:hypothetical protein